MSFYVINITVVISCSPIIAGYFGCSQMSSYFHYSALPLTRAHSNTLGNRVPFGVQILHTRMGRFNAEADWISFEWS